MIDLDLGGDGGILEDHDTVTVVDVVEELEEGHGENVIILLINDADLAVRLRIIVLDPIALYLLDQVRVVNNARFRSLPIRKAPPLTHPVGRDYEVAVRPCHLWVVVEGVPCDVL